MSSRGVEMAGRIGGLTKVKVASAWTPRKASVEGVRLGAGGALGADAPDSWFAWFALGP